jgi:hypothetical protein
MVMPLFQYFGWVGSFLLAALFAANWCCSVPVARAPRSDVPRDQTINIRIHTDRKWPERVVFGTTRSALTDEAKANAETDIGGSETPVLADRQPLDAFAEMAAIPTRPCFDRPAPPATPRSRTRRRLGRARHLEIARACR